MYMFMKPEDGNRHRPPKRLLNDNKDNLKDVSVWVDTNLTGLRWFEHISFRQTYILHTYRRNMKGKDMKAKGKHMNAT